MPEISNVAIYESIEKKQETNIKILLIAHLE